jgi:hypothetical protein
MKTKKLKQKELSKFEVLPLDQLLKIKGGGGAPIKKPVGGGDTDG